jgi:hypothetical protein
VTANFTGKGGNTKAESRSQNERQNSGVRSQKPEYKAENRFYRFSLLSFLLNSGFWILDSVFP